MRKRKIAYLFYIFDVVRWNFVHEGIIIGLLSYIKNDVVLQGLTMYLYKHVQALLLAFTLQHYYITHSGGIKEEDETFKESDEEIVRRC